MIVGILKSLLYMLLFFFVIRIFSYIFRFIYFFGSKKFQKTKNTEDADQSYALNMLQCEKCKVYIVKSEAYMSNGKVYCKKEHSV